MGFKRFIVGLVLVMMASLGYQGITIVDSIAHANRVTVTERCNHYTGNIDIAWSIWNDFSKTEVLSEASRLQGQINGKTLAVTDGNQSNGGADTLVATESVAPGSGTYTLSVRGTWSDKYTQKDSASTTVDGECTTQPKDDVRYQDIVNPVNCKHHTITTKHQESHRSYTLSGDEWVPGEWSPWKTVSKSVKHVKAPECTVFKHVRTRVHITDKCNCWRDKVYMTHGDNVRVKSTHPTRLTWVFTVTGKTVGNKHYLLPSTINGNHGWAKTQVYKVKTTNTPCPCKKTHTCHRAGPKHQHHSCKTACKLD